MTIFESNVKKEKKTAWTDVFMDEETSGVPYYLNKK